MPIPRVLAVVLALSSALAGCVEPDAADPPQGPAGPTAEVLEPLAFPVQHDGCRGIELFTAVPADSARGFVPDGFEVSDPAVAIVGAYVCGAEDELAGRGFVAIQVTAEDALASPTATNHFWEPEHYLVPGTTLTDAYRSARAEFVAAEVSVSVTSTDASFTIQAANATYQFTGTTAAAPGASGTAATALPPFREYAPADGGYAYLDAGFGGEDGLAGTAAGTLTVTGDGAGAALFGASSQRTGPAFTEYAYTDAVVGFIPWP